MTCIIIKHKNKFLNRKKKKFKFTNFKYFILKIIIYTIQLFN